MPTQNDYDFAPLDDAEHYLNYVQAGDDPDMSDHHYPTGFAEHNDIVCILRLRVHRSDTNNVASRNSLPDWRWVAWTVASAAPRSSTTTWYVSRNLNTV